MWGSPICCCRTVHENAIDIIETKYLHFSSVHGFNLCTVGVTALPCYPFYLLFY
jgi:hypothetical protein